MNKFTTPYLAKYGKATELIKGDCGWGSENWGLDKTNAVWKSVKRLTRHENMWWVWTTCESYDICNGTSDC